MQSLGYDLPLYILPFDHRANIAKTFFGLERAENLTDEQIHFLRDFKMLVYKGFKKAIENGIPKKYCAILCEEEFGDEVLIDASHNGFVTILTVEKSGTSKLEFEYDDFKSHITNFRPSFTKVLIKYNPQDSREQKIYQKEKLKIISDFSHSQNIKFLLEVLVNPTEDQLSKSNGDIDEYDRKVRPELTVEIIKDLQNFGVEPDVWKLEGFDSEFEYRDIVKAIKSGERKNVGLVVLGRGADRQKVEHWLSVGSKVEGVIGFAVGRTVFEEVLKKFYKSEVGKGEVIDTVADNFSKFYQIFTSQ